MHQELSLSVSRAAYHQYTEMKNVLEDYETRKKRFTSDKSNSVRSRGVYSWGEVEMSNKCIPTA